MTSTVGPVPIPYEVLRRDDGEIALAADAGLISFTPLRMVAAPGGIELHGEGLGERVQLPDVPEDVQERARRVRWMRFIEFGQAGVQRYLLLPFKSEFP